MNSLRTILTDCSIINVNIRFHVDNMKQLFQDIHIDRRIMTFLKDFFLTNSNCYFYKSRFVLYLYEHIMPYI